MNNSILKDPTAQGLLGMMAVCVALMPFAYGHDEANIRKADATIEQRLQASPKFKALFESNVRKCVELETSPLNFSGDRNKYHKAEALQQAAKEVEPACRRDELRRWQNAPSSYLVSKYG